MEATATRTVSPNQAKASIKHALIKQRPIFLWGPPGIGKSDIVRQVSNSLNKSHLIDIRLSLWDPTDIKGMPYYASNDNTMKWAPPVELPTQEFADQYDNIVLFLDEMNSAAPAVQAAAYQLILNRRVGTYKLPDNVMIVAAGNRQFEDQTRIANEATRRLQEVCDTNILFTGEGSTMALAPYLL